MRTKQTTERLVSQCTMYVRHMKLHFFLKAMQAPFIFNYDVPDSS